MSSEVYAVAAYAMRYWFLALIVLLILRSLRFVMRDSRRLRRLRRRLPDAGSIGEWIVVPSGEALPAPPEGWLGADASCDVRIAAPDVPPQAARFSLKKDGLHVVPFRGCALYADGEPVGREAVLVHGSTLQSGDTVLQLRIFAGIRLAGETVPANTPMPVPVFRAPEPETAPLTLPKPAFRMAFDHRRIREAYLNRETRPRT